MREIKLRETLPSHYFSYLYLLIFGSIILLLPISSKYIEYRYVFSWSMYNGSWEYEKYLVVSTDNTKQKSFTRSEIKELYGKKLLPYGEKALIEICKEDLSILSIERLGKNPIEVECKRQKP